MPHGTDQLPKIPMPAVISQMQEVIHHIDTPSWLSSVSQNLGEASVGTVKTEEWHILCLVHISLALVSLWGDGTLHDTADIAWAFCKILDNPMLLVSAVTLVCYQFITACCAKSYLWYITQYVCDLKPSMVIYHINPNIIWCSIYLTSLLCLNLFASGGCFHLSISLNTSNNYPITTYMVSCYPDI
jgi:hypothetical protein